MKKYSLVLASALAVLLSSTACGKVQPPTVPEDFAIPRENAGDLTLSGRVVDPAMTDDSGLAGALVTISRNGYATSTVTADDGSFLVTGLASGEWMLSASLEGYLEGAQALQLESDQSVVCFIDRESDGSNLTPVRKGRLVITKKPVTRQ